MKYFFLTIAAFVLIGTGWFGRGLLDGSLIARADADNLTKKAVEDAIQRQKDRDAAQPKIAESITAAQRASRIVPSASCPPGAGSLSDDVAERLRDAYGAPRH